MKRLNGPQLKILLVGPCPPPYGGIGTTVVDLHHHLVAQDSCEVEVLNIGEGRAVVNEQYLSVTGAWDYLNKVVRYARHGYVIHLETNGHNFKSWLSALVCSAAGLLNGRRTVIAFGSGNLPTYLQQSAGLARLVIRAVLTWAGVIICRNPSMLQALRAFGGERPRIEIVPGFMGLRGRQFGPLPKAVEEFCRSHEPVLGATVSLSPEYGVSLAIQALGRVRERYPHIGLILIGIGPETEPYLPELRWVRDRVLLAGTLSPDVTLSVMKRLSVFLRPTFFEGDSISVREALALGLPVVASDTGFRPNEVRRFIRGDCQDLCLQLDVVLSQAARGAPVKHDGHLQEGSAPRMLELYRKF